MAAYSFAGTQSAARSASWTDARVKAVMSRVLDDMLAVARRGFQDTDTVVSWYEDVSFVLVNEALERMEIQLHAPGLGPRAIRYEVHHQGLYLDTPSGGLNLYALPDSTRASILLGYRVTAPRLAEVRVEMARRGWGPGGPFVEGSVRQDHTYAKDGLGLQRGLVGWGR